MQNFEVKTAKELLKQLNHCYPKVTAYLNTNQGSSHDYIGNINQVRLIIEIAQSLFNLNGYSITEVIDELDKIANINN